jgi:hypothetical protein
VIARYAKRDIMRFFRANAAYAIPAIYGRLDEAGYFLPSGCPPMPCCVRGSRAD